MITYTKRMLLSCTKRLEKLVNPKSRKFNSLPHLPLLSNQSSFPYAGQISVSKMAREDEFEVSLKTIFKIAFPVIVACFQSIMIFKPKWLYF